MKPPSVGEKWLFVSDVDDTLLGDERALSELNKVLERERPRVGIALNSSRPCGSLHRSLRANRSLPAPDYLIGALGTEIEDAQGDPIEAFTRRLDSGWDRERIRKLVPEAAMLHPPEYQTAYKLSYDVAGAEVADEVRSRLEAMGIAATVMLTHGTKMDIIPTSAGKGSAIAFLREWLGLDRDRVVVAGDSANDMDMFTGSNRGIVVANADPELRALAGPHVYRAQKPYAGGVLEGLKHWNVV
jgi:sucrose-6-phosphatase